MKIGIDARILNKYVKHLLNALKQDKRNKYVLFFDSRIPKKQSEKYVKKNIKIKYFPFSQYRKYIRQAYSQILISGFLAKERLDIFHATCGTMPLIYRGKTVLNLWKIEKTLKEKIMQKKICKKAKKIIVSSENFKKRLIKNYKIKPGKIIIAKKRFNFLQLYREINS